MAWRGRDGRAESVQRADGIRADQWWQWLLALMRRGEQTWIWQMGACHGLTSLGFWDALTRGDWLLCGGTARVGTDGSSRTDHSSAGLCVLSDPPTIILARCSGSAGTTRWMDVRNLGLSGWYDIVDARCLGAVGTDRDASGVLCARAMATNRAGNLQNWLSAWYETVRELKLGGLRSTAASQSWAGWRQSYLNEIVECHNEQGRLNAESAAMYGGRCEVRRQSVRTDTVYQLDASAYNPALASGAGMPCRVCRDSGRSLDSAVSADRNGLCVIACGRLWTDRPCLPYRRCTRHSRPAISGRGCGLVGRGECQVETVYPVGTWEGWYCWPEWELLDRCGGKCIIDKWYAYEPGNPFGPFFTRLWQERLKAKGQGRTGHVHAIKLLMNSLIGKCAAEERGWRDCPDEFYPEQWALWHELQPDGITLQRHRSIAGRVQREVCEGYGAEAVPALAAWVYSLGRVQLWDWCEAAGWDNVLYTDTDSLWVTQEGFNELTRSIPLVSGVFGGLRLVQAHTFARFLGIRHYETDHGIVCAGIPQNAAVRTDGGWTYWAPESIPQSVQAWRQPLERLVRYDVSDRQSSRSGRVGVGGWVFPTEVCDG